MAHRLQRFAAKAKVGTPGVVAPAGRWLITHLIGPCVKLWWRPTMTGWDKLPDGPFLLVANHSGGGSAEIACLVYLWLRDQPLLRIAGLAYPSAFFFPGLAWLLRSIGAVPSSYEAAQAVLQSGIGVLVFPGGDHEAVRPVWQVHKVDFKKRQGYLRIARLGWVPIVPLGIANASYTSPVLIRSKLLAWVLIIPRLFGVKVWPITVQGLLVSAALLYGLPLHYAVPLVVFWLATPLSFCGVFPATISMRLGSVIAPETLFGSKGDDGPLEEAATRVEAEVQRLVVEGAP